jgi:hypothetical protein
VATGAGLEDDGALRMLIDAALQRGEGVGVGEVIGLRVKAKFVVEEAFEGVDVSGEMDLGAHGTHPWEVIGCTVAAGKQLRAQKITHVDL